MFDVKNICYVFGYRVTEVQHVNLNLGTWKASYNSTMKRAIRRQYRILHCHGIALFMDELDIDKYPKTVWEGKK